MPKTRKVQIIDGALISTDATLTQEGAAADAKIVGDRLNELETLQTQIAHIRYSAYEDGTDFTDVWSAGLNYIGIAVAPDAPTDKAEYEWSLFASNIRSTTTVTLVATGWTDNAQTVSVSSIGCNSSVFSTPHPDSKDAYIDNGIILESATTTTLTFSCTSTPTPDVLVNVQIVEPLVNNESTCLPEVTDADNGKILQVVDGQWKAVVAQTYIAVATEAEATDTTAHPIVEGQVIVVTGE